jgi:NAD(P)H-flavin reductase
MTIEVTVDHADVAWHGHVGVLTKLIERIVVNPDHAVALVCGPEIMMRFAASALQTAGIKPESIHLSLERNMKCAIGQCGRCQFGSNLLCRDGAVMRYDRVRPLLTVREL